MNRYPDARTSAWSRLLVLPTVTSLLAASVIAGYASGGIFPGRSRHAHDVTLAFDVPDTPQTAADAAQTDSSEDANDPLANYRATMALLKQDYYGTTVDDKKVRQLTYDAIRGMLGSLKDQFTSFLDPDEWTQMQITTRGDFEGIGAYLAQDGPNVRVVEPIEGGPAEKAGVKADDVIVRVDGKPILGKDINDVVRIIKGKPGTHVHLGVVRGKAPMEFTITRATVEPPVVKYWMEDPQYKIGHIVLTEFNEKSVARMDYAYNELKKQGMRALVFDLRNNPGGLLEVAIQVASKFIPADSNPTLHNAVIYIHEGSGREQPRNLVGVDEGYWRVPLVVLVNENSASASEIVSGAIKDYGVGTLIGERTFGKGRVQTLFPLTDGSALRLTTQLYYPPRHHDINFKRDDEGNKVQGTGGILPDIVVKQPDKWKRFTDKTDDAQLQKALQVLRAKLTAATTASAKG